MADPGVVAALGIEAVEWLDEAGDRVTVRISGRWRRRPTSPGQPSLVVESHGERHRFPAMPEPPGLTGMMPGTWRMSFRAPGAIARAPDVRAWLQLGAVLVPLPSEPAAPDPAAPDRDTADRDTADRDTADRDTADRDTADRDTADRDALDPLAADPGAAEPISATLEPRSVGVFELEEAAREEQLRETERALAAERARTTAAEAAAADLAARVAGLSHELEHRASDVSQLTTALAEHDRSLRDARQHAHSEEMVRLELARERDRLSDMLEVSRVRVSGLEDELTGLQRRADEAEHQAAAARRASPPPPPPAPVRPPSTHRTRVYASERAHARATRGVVAPTVLRRLPARPVWSGRERELVALRTRRAMRPHGEHLAATLEALRGELSDLRAICERERRARSTADTTSDGLRRELEQQQARSARAYAALDELRDQIEWVRQAYAALKDNAGSSPPVDAPPDDAAADPAPEPPRNGDFEPRRLDAARNRLREQTPAHPEDAPDESSPTPPSAAAEKSPPALPALVMDTRPPFTLAPIAERDPEEAGRLLLKLLPAQGIVHPSALAYDLVLDPATCVRVTVSEGGATEVNWMHTARARGDVRFRLDGDPASIIRLLTAGGLARRLRWRRLARIHGDRSGLAALGDLMAARLLAPDLSGVGVRRDDLELDVQVEVPNHATSG